jgi:ABC-2 type transport system permease protein
VSAFLAILRRELLSFWVSPLAWVLLVVFLLLQGLSFHLTVQHFAHFTTLAVDYGPIQGYFGSPFIPLSLLLLCPALPMRLFAEERRTGTIDGLLSAPASATAIVLGKYLATLVTYVALWLPTLLYVVILRNVSQIDWAVVASSYLGVVAVGASYLGLGTLASAMANSQLTALLLTLLVVFGMFLFGVGERIFDAGPLLEVSQHVSVLSQIEELSRGIIDLRRLFFDSSIVALSLFVTVRLVDAWRYE